MRFLTFICTLSLAFQLVADDAKDPFPAFDSLKPPVLMPYKAKLTVSKEGHFLINGVPRYLEGTIFYETAANNAITTPTYGYPAILNWLYESAQGYKNLQRIGFDTVGAAAPNWWIDKYRTKYIRNTIEEKEQDRYIHSGLPLYVDYTCAGWHHGALKFVQGQEPVKNAFTVPGKGNYHWLPYSATTPEGRQLWREMWTYGVEYFQKLGVKPFCYELLNEPDYNDVSEFNRSLFVERMKNKYQNDLARLNREWGTSYENFEAIGKFKVSTENIALAVEWIKFMEDAFADLCSEGAKTIRSIDKRPEVGIGFQPLSHYRTLNTNLYSANRDLNMIITGTGGGDILHSHLLRAIGDGKPIMDGETYMGKTRSSFRNKILQQYGRGYNASYIFKWSRRATDPLWSNPRPDGAKKLAQKFPYMMLNPYAVPAEALLGLMDAKKELMQVSDLFTPRDRGVAREVAVLFSYPTQRLARSAGSRVGELVVGYTEALEYAQIPIDVVLEEQLPEGRLDRYKVLVSAGTNATYPESPALLEAYVRNGGVLILGQEALQTNEYGANRPGFPGIAVGAERIGERGKFKFAGVEITAAPYKDVTLDSSWTQLAKLGDKPIVFEKSLGKGKVIYLNAKFPRDGLGDILGALLKREKINPTCLITDAETGARVDGVEAVKASRNGFVGYMLTNSRLAPRLVRFTPPEKVAFADITGQNMLETKDGGILVLLKPDDAVILLGGEASALQKRCGKLPLKTYETLKAEGKAAIEEHWARTKKDSPAFIVDRDRVAIVDLHSYANRDFVDKVPGDGKGGWTDQGAVNSLHDVEWGIRDCAGVPFEFIRTDQNEERTCIVLKSKNDPKLPAKIDGIKVDLPADRVFFLHAAAWSSDNGQEGFRYVINYSDGTKAEIPIRDGIEVGEWYWPLKRIDGMKFVPGFVNVERRGVFVYEWKNPYPQKTISTIDIVSADTKLIPIIVGITIEQPDKTRKITPLLTGKLKVKEWGGVKTVVHPDRYEIGITENGRAWCGVGLTATPSVPLPPDATKLVFEVNGAKDQWGRSGILAAPFQVTVYGLDAEGKFPKVKYVTTPYDFKVDDKPETWQKLELPLDRMLGEGVVNITGMGIQYRILPAERAGIEIRNIHLE